MQSMPFATRTFIFVLFFGFTLILRAEPTGPEGYIYLGKEGETVQLNERASVAYGAQGKFAYKHNVDPGRIALTNGTFGDPNPGVPKFAFYRPGFSSEFDESEILKSFPLVHASMLRSMLLARPGVRVEGSAKQPEKLVAEAKIEGANVQMHLSVLGEDSPDPGKVRTLAFTWTDSSNRSIDIWTDKARVAKVFQTFLSPQLAERMTRSWSGAVQSYEAVEYGRNRKHDIYRRTGITTANTPLPAELVKFSTSAIYSSDRPGGAINQFSGKPEADTFEIRRGINRDFTVFMMHAFDPKPDIVATQEALKQMPTEQQVQESQKPYVYGKVEKRRSKSHPRIHYYVYVPAGHNPAKTYDLILTFHGDGGSGKFFAEAFSGMAQKNNFIVVSPNYGYGRERENDLEGAGPVEEGQWIEDEIRANFKVNPETYLVSFSAGGLYAYIYAQNHPERVAAFTSNSTSWTGLAASVDRNIPSLVTCGLSDPRFHGARGLYDEMLKMNFKKAQLKLFPNIGHQFSSAHVQAISAFFLEVQRDTGKSYLQEYTSVFQQIRMEDLAGNYRRNSGGRTETGRIYFDTAKGHWRWSSKEDRGSEPGAEFSWVLKPALHQEKLLTGEGNPYLDPQWFDPDEREAASYFLILLQRGPRGYLPEVAGFIFNGNVYEKQ